MKILTRQGERELSATDLASYDANARKQLTRMKRAKIVHVEDDLVYFNTSVRCQVPPDMQTLLRHLANLRKHGKAYAPMQVDAAFEDVHWQISRGYMALLPVKFNLDTGDLTIAPRGAHGDETE